MTRTRLLAAFLIGACASPAAGQSLFAARGLGLPMPAVDARARSLGGVGVGLLGLNTSFVNPAEVAGLVQRGVSAVLQPTSGSAELGGEEDGIDGTRFPMVRLLMPLSSRTILTVGYGAELEQSWAIATEGFERLGADSIGTRDVIRSTGGISRVGVTAAYAISSRLAVGLSAGLHAGNLERRVTRTFSDTSIGLRTFETTLRWEYRGPVGVVGLRWDPLPIARVGASLAVSGDLDIDGREGIAADDKAEMPLRLSAGASGYLAPELLLALGTEYAWGGEGVVFGGTGSIAERRNAWRWGGGIEWGGAGGGGGRSYPIRLGGSYTQLPYFDIGETPASEWSGSFGIGFRLANEQAGPLAVLDAAVERGGRSGLESETNPDGLSESFWRFTFSLSIFGR